jgi:signal transduction histidine kinase/ActR/RegA family two-component response regulator
MDTGHQLRPVRDLAAAFVAFALVSWLMAETAPAESPSLHNILDSGIFVLSGVLALMLWDMGARLGQPLPQLAAICFGATAAFELLHALAAVDFIADAAAAHAFALEYRPLTWPPPSYLLPIGLVAAAYLSSRPRRLRLPFGVSLVVVGAGMLYLFYQLPRYTPPYFGVTRPTLLLVPVVWLLVFLVYWRRRHDDRIAGLLSLLALIAMTANVGIIFSRAPADDAAVFSHLGKFFARLFLLFSLAQLGTADMARRIRAERELRSLNESLEQRVRDRTAALQAANAGLRDEIAQRESAEKRTREQLERMHLLRQITHAIGERQDMDDIAQTVVRRVEEYMPADFACLCRHEHVVRTLTVSRLGRRAAAFADAVGLRENERVEIGGNGLARSLRGDLVYENDTTTLAFDLPRRFARAGLHSLVIAPLVIEQRGTVFGVLIVARSARDAFSSGECEFLNQLCSQVALASNQAQLHASLQSAYDEMRNTQNAVMQQERLRSLGQMASGIAHDVNNAMSPVMLYLEMLLKGERNLSERGRQQLETMQRSIGDVAHTIARMGEFYRKHDPRRELLPVNVNVILAQIPDLTRARWSDIALAAGVTIQLHVEEAPEVPTILAVESELREALINLVLNAADALPRGGNITLRARQSTGAGGHPAQTIVEVSDDGVGMDENTRRRCLEPFFTTKGERGTGLGLAMVYGIAERHGGGLEIDSAPGKGTVVRLRFDTAQRDRASEVTGQVQAEARRYRILVIDDDPVLLSSLRDALEYDGHQVTCADGGQAGIDAFLLSVSLGQPYPVVITDLGMPHIDGRRVAIAVKHSSPSTVVLMLTGWGQRMAAIEPLPASVDKVLSKPPNMWQLNEAIAAVRIPP